MSKVSKILALIFLFSFSLLFYLPHSALAANCTFTFDPPTPYQNMGDLPVTITSKEIKSGTYSLVVYQGNNNLIANIRDIKFSPGTAVTTQIRKKQNGWDAGKYTIYFRDQDIGGSVQDVAVCRTSFTITDIPAQSICLTSIETKPIDTDTKVVLKISGIASGDYNILINDDFYKTYNTNTGETAYLCKGGTEDKNCKFNVGTYTVTIKNQCGLDGFTCKARLQCIPVSFSVAPFGSGGGGQVGTGPVPTATPCTGSNCSSGGGKQITGCGDKDHPAISTAIGCIHTSPAEFVKDFLTFIIGIGGGLAFLLMLLGVFQMLTSAGNPETWSAGRDRLQSAIIGLLFVIFAVLLLQIIGFDILNLPGFGR